jgi:beta-glucosidase
MTIAGHTIEPYKDPGCPLEDRVEDLLARLTLEEKVSLMAGAAAFALTAIPRLGVPSLRMTDGPTGVRSNTREAATVFPVAVALAATWNPALAGEVAAAIAREAKALGEHVVLAPTINMVRTPLWGRNFETYSEDPYLAGRLAIDYVNGLQNEGIGASLKHYAANNQEHRRLDVSVELDERTLREIYTAAFEMVVRRANPWTVMASYNKVRGLHATESPHLLRDILKREWGYDGVVVSDWGAVHSTVATARAGLDLEMPGPPKYWGDKLLAAVKAGEVETDHIDDAARRLVRLILRCGLLDGGPAPVGELRTERHQAIARKAAGEAFVLLKNDGDLLPLNPHKLRRLAVIGPNAETLRVQGDGSSHVRAGRKVTPLESLRALLGDDVELIYAKGCDNEPFPPAAVRSMFSPTEAREAEGLTLQFFAEADFSGEPTRATVDRRMIRWVSAFAPEAAREPFKALRWRGWFWPNESGLHEFGARGDGDVWLKIDGETLIDPSTPGPEDSADSSGAPAKRRLASIELAAGRAYAIDIDYVWAPLRAGEMFETFALGVREPRPSIAEAVEAASKADAAVVIVGSAASTESEGYDRGDLELPGPQNALVKAVLEANPNTVVALNIGAPMVLPWIDQARAVLLAWLPGEEGPDALAEVIFGKVAPSGRLPVTFPARLEDNPSFPFYPGGDQSHYDEGLFIGYRHYDKAGVAPAFAFGHGLTYTRFNYADLAAPMQATTGQPVSVSVRISNIGAREGQETVQLYIHPHAPSQPRPVKELKGFSKVRLQPGESKTVNFELTAQDFSFFDADSDRWRLEDGAYDILIGASAADLKLNTTVKLSQ